MPLLLGRKNDIKLDKYENLRFSEKILVYF